MGGGEKKRNGDKDSILKDLYTDMYIKWIY
jgi:hypothetical protein